MLNYLGYAWTERGEQPRPGARQMIERAVQQRPNDGAIIDSLGWVLLRQGDAPAALKQLERAVELQPEDSVINGHLGDALAAVGPDARGGVPVAPGAEPEARAGGRQADRPRSCAALPQARPPAQAARARSRAAVR